MWTKNKVGSLLVTTLLLFVFLGCSFPEKKAEISVLNRPNPSKESAPTAGRFGEPASGNPTVVESAMALSKKYAELSNETNLLKHKNEQLTAENRHLNEKLASVEAELTQTQKELTEANKLLIEMRIELNNWKTDILGFRDEMREAETAQLHALFKILKILGGEIKVDESDDKIDSAYVESKERTD